MRCEAWIVLETTIIRKSSIISITYLSIIFASEILLMSLKNSSIFLLLVIFGLFCLLLFVFKSNNKILVAYIFLIITVFQNTLIGLSANFSQEFNFNAAKYYIVINFIFALISLLLVFLKKPIIRLSLLYLHEKYLLFFSILVIIYSLTFTNHLISTLAYFRNFILLGALYYLGYSLINNEHDFKRFESFIRKLSLGLLTFGIIEYFLLNDIFWRTIIHVDVVFWTKGLMIPADSIPTMWYTNFFGYHVRRMVSIFMEPVNISYFFAFVAVLEFSKLLFSGSRINIMNLLLFCSYSICCLLTFGKGGLLVLLVGMITILIFKFSSNGTYFNVLFILKISSIFLLAYMFYKYFGYTALPHFMGLFLSFRTFLENPIGHGVGSGGNFKDVLVGFSTEQEWLSSGSESAIATILYQLGIFGFILFLGFILALYLLSKKHFFLCKELNIRYLFPIYGCLPFCLFITSFFQENSLSPQATGVYLLYTGMITKYLLLKGVFIREKKSRY